MTTSLSPFVSKDYFDKTLQELFARSDEIFENINNAWIIWEENNMNNQWILDMNWLISYHKKWTSQKTPKIFKKNTKFYQKIDQEKHIYNIAISSENVLEKMSVNNRVGGNFEVAKLEIETLIEMKLDEIKAEHMKTLTPLTLKYHLSHQTNLLRILNNQPLISWNGHS